jgi:hypothetical protein
MYPPKASTHLRSHSDFIKLSGPLVTATLDTVKLNRFSEVEVTCQSVQSNNFEFKWQPATKEDADIAPADVIYILPLFAHNTNGPDGEVGRHSSALVLKRNTRSEDTYQRVGLQLWAERMGFRDALEMEITII